MTIFIVVFICCVANFLVGLWFGVSWEGGDNKESAFERWLA